MYSNNRNMENYYNGIDIDSLIQSIIAIKEQIGVRNVNKKMSRALREMHGNNSVRDNKSHELRILEARLKRMEDSIIRRKTSTKMHNGGRKRVTRRKKSIRKKR